jgi:coniferyl-aldehyde dehydrogenase
VDLGVAFSKLRFDHLLYTGSTHVGRLVMQEAAANLTPVTLELGGKSPVIVHKSYAVKKAAERIMSGKLFNAGQTCIAPDYILVHESKMEQLVSAMRQAVGRMYPSLTTNPDYTAIVNERHKARLEGYVADAEAKGARVVELNPAKESFEDVGTKLMPRIFMDVTDEMVLMQDEIFGPLLPVVPYRTLDEAMRYVNTRPRPLALYYFDEDADRQRRVLEHTTSGGVSINATILHAAQEELPFGGVGPSGMGAYHGKVGFDTLSHRKGVFYQAKLNASWLFNPPYGRRIEKLLDYLL